MHRNAHLHHWSLHCSKNYWNEPSTVRTLISSVKFNGVDICLNFFFMNTCSRLYCFKKAMYICSFPFTIFFNWDIKILKNATKMCVLKYNTSYSTNIWSHFMVTCNIYIYREDIYIVWFYVCVVQRVQIIFIFATLAEQI